VLAYDVRAAYRRPVGESRALRVAVVGEQILLVGALSKVLSEDPLLDACCITTGFARALPIDAPDIVVLDLDCASYALAAEIAAWRAYAAEVRVLVISVRLEAAVLERCIEAGADGYFVKDGTPDQLIDAVKRIASGATYVDARIAGHLLFRNPRAKGAARRPSLSRREHEVLGLLAQGLVNKEISERLHVSHKTVKNHVSSIIAKLESSSRTQAAVHAIRAGLV
jgi:two-component system, NarL family, response regulator DegU